MSKEGVELCLLKYVSIVKIPLLWRGGENSKNF
jgi:hypothetical protein